MQDGANNKQDELIEALSKRLTTLNLEAIEEVAQEHHKSPHRFATQPRTRSVPINPQSSLAKQDSEFSLPFSPRRSSTFCTPRDRLYSPRQSGKLSAKGRDKKSNDGNSLYEDFDIKIESPLTTPRGTPPKALKYAEELKVFSSDLIRRFTQQDFFDKKYSGAKKILDQAFNRLIEQTKKDILQEQSHKFQQQYYDYYTQVLRSLLNLLDFHDAYAIYLALSSPEVSKLCKTTYHLSLSGEISVSRNREGYLTLPIGCRKKFKDALRLFSFSNHFYAETLKQHISLSTVPVLALIYRKADLIKQMSDSSAHEIELKNQGKSKLLAYINQFTGTDSTYQTYEDYTDSRRSSIIFSLTPRGIPQEENRYESTQYAKDTAPKRRQDQQSSFSGYSTFEDDEAPWVKYKSNQSYSSDEEACSYSDSETNIVLDEFAEEKHMAFKMKKEQDDSFEQSTLSDSSTDIVIDEFAIFSTTVKEKVLPSSRIKK